MPRRRLRNVDRRAYRDICHPLDNEVRKELTDAILKSASMIEYRLENIHNELKSKQAKK